METLFYEIFSSGVWTKWTKEGNLWFDPISLDASKGGEKGGDWRFAPNLTSGSVCKDKPWGSTLTTESILSREVLDIRGVLVQSLAQIRHYEGSRSEPRSSASPLNRQKEKMGSASEDLLVTLQILPGFFSNCLFLALYDSVVLVKRVVTLLSRSHSAGCGEWRRMLTSEGLRSIWNSFLLDAYKQVRLLTRVRIALCGDALRTSCFRLQVCGSDTVANTPRKFQFFLHKV